MKHRILLQQELCLAYEIWVFLSGWLHKVKQKPVSNEEPRSFNYVVTTTKHDLQPKHIIDKVTNKKSDLIAWKLFEIAIKKVIDTQKWPPKHVS